MRVEYIRFNKEIPVLTNDNPMGNVGYDLQAVLDEVDGVFEGAGGLPTIMFEPYEQKLIPVNVAIAPPIAQKIWLHSDGLTGMEAVATGLLPWTMIAGRSGMNNKGWLVYPGIIDNNYRGQLKVVIQNHKNEKGFIQQGDRIAQLLFLVSFVPELVEVEKLSVTDRGIKGFGSSGVK